MSGLVERLRKDADSWGGAIHTVAGPNVAALEREAADAIAALVAERDALRKALEPFAEPHAMGDNYVKFAPRLIEDARAALKSCS